ncbi:MAG: polysaccharide biosynthesis tyrosine autokinase [Gammaproteobacteria bacterium]|nr:polysaccharide biosynthesis tyrosine autokinase [Gammaproteobacteria bacterium]
MYMAGGSGATALLFGGEDDAQIQTQMAIMRSSSLLGQVVTQHHLNVDVQPNYFPGVGRYIARHYGQHNFTHQPASSWFWANSYSWGGDQLEIDNFTVPDHFQNKSFTVVVLGEGRYQLLLNGVSLFEGTIGQTLTQNLPPFGDVALKVKSLNARPGVKFSVTVRPIADVVDTLAHTLILQQPQETHLIKLSFRDTNPEKAAAILNAIVSVAMSHSEALNRQQQTRTANFIESELPLAANKLKAAQGKLVQYEASVNFPVYSGGKEGPGVESANLASTIQSMETQRSLLSAQYTDNSFQIQQLDTTLKRLKAEKASIDGGMQTMLSLTREVSAAEETYGKLLTQLQNVRLLEAGASSSLQLIDSAETYFTRRVDVPTLGLLVGGMVLGFLAGVLWIGFARLMVRGMTDPEDIESLTGLRFLSAFYESNKFAITLKKYKKQLLPHLKFLEEVDPYDVTLESLRGLVTSLKFDFKAGAKIIGISGPSPEIGKSFVSANLAHVLASQKMKVLLIDVDDRRGHLNQFFGKAVSPGWVQLVHGSHTIDQVIQHTRVPGLDFIPTGRTQSQNGPHMLSLEAMQELFQSLAARYDAVVLDTPPVLAVSDAGVVLKAADINLLVFAHGRHSVNEVKHTVNVLKNMSVSVHGFLLNRVKNAGGEGGYGYHYRYEKRAKTKETASV